ncbi:uncharacterized protein Dwil_GK27742 [Drosophila willistoni]|uniref:Uncharacterized protein n=1 Tax=Drosophila willistoni TaxID=7260 RepID=A0A0Q9WW98_DROWI|nr:uncharacterized protein Dwil_GK27742 [Drosophila willistoni]
MEGLGNCCYFFDLKTGCQLISLVEALSSMLQIYQSYSELYEKQMAISSIRPVVTTTTDVSSLSLHHVHEQHPMYNMGMGTVTILSALLLFFGVKFVSSSNHYERHHQIDPSIRSNAKCFFWLGFT